MASLTAFKFASSALGFMSSRNLEIGDNPAEGVNERTSELKAAKELVDDDVRSLTLFVQVHFNA